MTTTMTCRQLTADEAHKLDHLIDALLTKGTLVVKPNLIPLVEEAKLIFGGSYLALQRYVHAKTTRVLDKKAEEYDEGPADNFDRPLRAPFGGTWEGVPEDWITRQYLKESYQDRGIIPEVDLSAGTGDRLEMGMKMRRRHGRS
jgi:hypothetical protein